MVPSHGMGNAYHTSDGRFAKRPDGVALVRKARAPTVKTDWAPSDELGRSSRQRYGSNLFDDFLPQLRGSNALRVWREMVDNDATIGAILFAIEMLLRQATWTAEPASDSSKDAAAALFVDECAGDMTHTWPDHVSAALTMLPFGFSWFEQVFKVRRPPDSQFNDGKLGWKHMGFRPQDTLNEWQYREDGSVAAFVQDTGTVLVSIPAEKSVHYRTSVGRGAPEGRSILRNAYRSWFFKKRSEEILLIGEERALAGLPVMQIPAESIISADSAYTRYSQLVKRVRQDEQMGVIIPSDLWPGTTEPMFKFDTLKSEGPRSLDPVEVVRMFAGDIAASVLAGFIYLGRDSVGSRALASPMQELFQKALESWLDSMEDTFHHQAVLPLLQLNGFQTETPPHWKHGSVADVDLLELGQFIQQVSASGYDWGVLDPADPIRDQWRTMAGFDPEPQANTRKRLPVRKRWDQGKQLWLLP